MTVSYEVQAKGHKRALFKIGRFQRTIEKARRRRALFVIHRINNAVDISLCQIPGRKLAFAAC